MSTSFRSWLPAVSGAVLAMGGLTTLGLWVYQVYQFAKHGAWAPISTNDIMLWLTGQYWFMNPTDWLGVHRALDWLNGGVAIWVAAVLLAFSIASLDDIK